MKAALRMVIWLVMLGGGMWGGFSLDRLLFPVLSKNVWFHLASFIAGLLTMKLVITISRNTGRMLAHFGRQGNIPRMETNRLVTTGVYRYMRHPMHLGLLFFPLAFALLAGSPSFILIIAPAEAAFMLLMIKWVEEPEARHKFGKAYLEYMQQVPWFCVRKECLKALFEKVEKKP